METIDWKTIKTEYITDPTTSYRTLSEKYGVSYMSITKRAGSEGWVAARKKHAEKVISKTLDKNAREESKRLARMQRSADKMSGVIENIFKDTDQFYRHIVTEGTGMGESRTECRVMEKVDTKAIKDLTSAMKDLTYVLRNLYGIPTVLEKSAMDIAAERLHLDKQKASAQLPDDDEDSGVIMIAEVEGDVE